MLCERNHRLALVTRSDSSRQATTQAKIWGLLHMKLATPEHPRSTIVSCLIQNNLPHRAQRKSRLQHLPNTRARSCSCGSCTFLAVRTDTHCLSQNALTICFYAPGTGSLLFFIAIIVVLRVLDGRPLPNTKIGITPNAIVGLLATFLELSLVVPMNSAVGQIKWLRALRARPMHEFSTIDEASRGPWGSLFLLARRSGG